MLTFSFLCPATTIQDPFRVGSDNCLQLSCDVIGPQIDFDIQTADVSITATSIDVTVYFNYGGGITLSPFDSPTVNVGDLFFYDPSNPKIKLGNGSFEPYLFGVPLTSHDGLTAGQLYEINNPGTVQTAAQVLGNPSGVYYRPDQPVWMATGQETSVGTGHGVTVTNNNGGNGLTSAEYAASVHITTSGASQFLNLFKNGQIGVVFESATCANDVLTGMVSVGAPEPGAMSMMALGFGMLAGVGVWKRRSARKQS